MPHTHPDVTRDSLDSVADHLTIPEAAKLLRLGQDTIRLAITSGQLPAFIPGGREPRRAGRGVGYRIRKEDLQRWYFGS